MIRRFLGKNGTGDSKSEGWTGQPAALLIVVVLGCGAGTQGWKSHGATPDPVELTASAEAVVLRGVPEVATRLAGGKGHSANLEPVLEIFVVGQDLPAIAGEVSMEEGVLRFSPKFQLRRGIEYVAVLNLGDNHNPDLSETRFEFSVPGSNRSDTSAGSQVTARAATRVVRIEPAVDAVPSNLLRFYIHFSDAMSRGDSYRFIELRNGSGERVEEGFLELDEELWTADGRRLTLLLDPGRIKSGLIPSEELGAALRQDFDVVLRVSQAWLDAGGQPLKEESERRFSVGPPDYESPNPGRWEIATPRVATKESLQVQLRDTVDSALLQRFLWVEKLGSAQKDGATKGDPWNGTATATNTTWTFVPDREWLAGTYRLVVDVRLEDLAGNRVDRLFERELEPAPEPSTLRSSEEHATKGGRTEGFVKFVEFVLEESR